MTLKIANFKIDFKQEYAYIGIIAFFALISIFLLFRACVPNLSRCVVLIQESIKKDKDLIERKNTIAQMQRLKQDITQIENDYKDFIQKVLLEPGSMEAVRTITNIAQGIKINFASIQPLASARVDFSSAKKEGFSQFFKKEGIDFSLWELPVTIRIKAKYVDFLSLLKRLEESQKFMRVKNININKDVTSPLEHNIEITVSMFSLPEAGIVRPKK